MGESVKLKIQYVKEECLPSKLDEYIPKTLNRSCYSPYNHETKMISNNEKGLNFILTRSLDN